MSDGTERRKAYEKGIQAPTTFAAPANPVIRKERDHTGKYTPQIARKICNQIMEGKTLKEICAKRGMPTKRTILRWLSAPQYADFREQYYYARRVQAELRVDEIFEIADNTEHDWKPRYNKNGELIDYVPDNEAIQRSRVRIDTRKWYAARLIPRIYGDRVEHTHEVTGDLAELLARASNNDRGLPKPIDVTPEKDDE